MNNNSTWGNIFKLVGFFVVAGLAIRVVLALLGGLFYVAFKFGVPLLIAILIVRWLTERRNNRANY